MPTHILALMETCYEQYFAGNASDLVQYVLPEATISHLKSNTETTMTNVPVAENKTKSIPIRS